MSWTTTALLSCGQLNGGAVGPGAGATDADELDNDEVTGSRLGATVVVTVPSVIVERIVVVS